VVVVGYLIELAVLGISIRAIMHEARIVD